MLIAVGMFGFHSFSEKMSNRNEKCRDKKQFFRRCTGIPIFSYLSMGGVNPPVCKGGVADWGEVPTDASDCSIYHNEPYYKRKIKSGGGNAAGMVMQIS